ncbi:MAG TPA: ETC complex I subunit [Kiloniellales bacterium]|nr:ETC complex I subunit [Kiloniellales bacterium]
MQVRIFQLPKTAMQQGRGLTKRWVLEFEPDAPRAIEPLMGWVSSRDTRQQLRLWFETQEEAIAYAERHGYMYTLERPRKRVIRPKSYGENFRADRLHRWTH